MHSWTISGMKEISLSKAQENYLRQLKEIAEQVPVEQWSELTATHVKQVLSHARRKGLSPRSISPAIISVAFVLPVSR